ncbi:hypothetical protein Ahia01_001231100 [Argonauta hians]
MLTSMKVVIIFFVAVSVAYARRPGNLLANYGDDLEYADYYKDVSDGELSTELPVDNGGLHQGGRVRPGINCGHFDSKDTTHLVSDPDHEGTFYFCVNGVSVGPMTCAQGTVFHPVYKVCSWPNQDGQIKIDP